MEAEELKRKQRTRYGWDLMYAALLTFGEERGHYNVPRRFECQFPPGTLSEDGKPLLSAQLGSWLTTQRIFKQQKKLRPEREALLQKLVDEGKLEWTPMTYVKMAESSWPHMFECLELYCNQRLRDNPDCEATSIPEKKRWLHPEGYEVGLGRWMHTQNKRRRSGQLRPDRLAKLQELVDQRKLRWPLPRQKKSSAPGSHPNDVGSLTQRNPNRNMSCPMASQIAIPVNSPDEHYHLSAGMSPDGTFLPPTMSVPSLYAQSAYQSSGGFVHGGHWFGQPFLESPHDSQYSSQHQQHASIVAADFHDACGAFDSFGGLREDACTQLN